MSSIKNSVLAPRSLVLVTGVNGLVGSQVADQLLQNGLRVRGSVRDVEKNSWMLKFFEDKFGRGVFELIEVKDIAQEGAFDEAVAGVSGVIHVASVVNFDYDADRVFPIVVNSTVGILQSAAGEASVKRFALTSSISAAIFPKPDHRFVVTADTWNEEAVLLSRSLPEEMSEFQKGFLVYSASKAKGEQAMWDWVKKNKPSFVVNSVLPGSSFGKVLSPENQGYPSTAMFPPALYTNNKDLVAIMADWPPEYFVDLQDNARLHVAALVHPDVQNERIFACNSPYNWNDCLKALRQLFPGKQFPDDYPDMWDDLAIMEPAKRAESLLQDMGREGFTTLEESLRLNVEGC